MWNAWESTVLVLPGISSPRWRLIEGKRVFAFTRPGDTATQAFARRLGAYWAGGSDEMPPEELDAALVLAPVGALMVTALKAVAKGGVVVSGGIHMTDIPSFPYHLLWEERTIRQCSQPHPPGWGGIPEHSPPRCR